MRLFFMSKRPVNQISGLQTALITLLSLKWRLAPLFHIGCNTVLRPLLLL